jgi:hypothetical protein
MKPKQCFSHSAIRFSTAGILSAFGFSRFALIADKMSALPVALPFLEFSSISSSRDFETEK